MSLVHGVPEQPARALKPAGSLSIMLVDHSPTFRAGLRHAVERVRDMRVVCELAQGSLVFEPAFHFDADVAVIDADLPDRSCIEVGHRLITQRPGLAVLLLSDWDWDVYLVAARAARAAGLLLRSSEPADLTWAIRQAASAPIFTPDQLERVQRWSQALGTRLRTLAPREWEVLWLVSEGMRNGDIAQKLSLTDNTVEKHIGNIYEKLGLHSRGKLLALILAEHIEVISRLARGTSPLRFV
jgi:DNA-binding NarL/FixJ family response regulator